MRTVICRQHGVLRVEDAPRPEPGEGEVLVEVAAAGVTLPVVRLTSGGGTLPLVPGGEVVGRVVSATGGWRTGQRVAALAFTGAYAEFALVGSGLLAAVPDEVDDAAAVALVRSGQVALGALRTGGVRPGESVLVTAAAGGVGHLAVQLARAVGAGRVVAAVGTDAKREFARGLGAHEVVRYGEPPAGPVDVVLDSVGGDVQNTYLEHLAPFGRLVSYSATGAPVDVNQLRMHARSVVGFAMSHFARPPVGRLTSDVYARQQGELWELYIRGVVRPAVHVMPLAEAEQAHRLIESRENLGKVVLSLT